MIAAVGEDNALGKDNDLLWHLPDDFKRFKNLTTGHTIIMGRKTFESFPKPLPNRTHIIITRDINYETQGLDCLVVHSLEQALQIVANEDTSFIIGGGEIYKQGARFANKMELTRVHGVFEDADTFFPEILSYAWTIVHKEDVLDDPQNDFAYTFEIYERKEA